MFIAELFRVSSMMNLGGKVTAELAMAPSPFEGDVPDIRPFLAVQKFRILTPTPTHQIKRCGNLKLIFYQSDDSPSVWIG
jgi:hypothetical protein